MGFPPVKSNPYEKGKRQRRRHSLWPLWFWKVLVKEAQSHWNKKMPDEIVAMIGDMNERLYGMR